MANEIVKKEPKGNKKSKREHSPRMGTVTVTESEKCRINTFLKFMSMSWTGFVKNVPILSADDCIDIAAIFQRARERSLKQTLQGND